MSWELKSIQTVDGGLTSEALAEHAALSDIPGERPLKKSRVKFLTERAQLGEFNRCEWARCLCKSNGKHYRVNGNHSKAVLMGIESGDIEAEFPSGIPIQVQVYECDELTDLANVFDQFDNPHSSRNSGDKLGVYVAQHDDLIGIDKGLIGRVLAGVDWARNNVPAITERFDSWESLSAYDRGALLHDGTIREFVDFIARHKDGTFTVWEQKAGIIASIFQQYLQDEETADLLITQTMNELGDECEDYCSKMRRKAKRTGSTMGEFYRVTNSHFNKLNKLLKGQGADAIRALINEALDAREDEADDGEPKAG